MVHLDNYSLGFKQQSINHKHVEWKQDVKYSRSSTVKLIIVYLALNNNHSISNTWNGSKMLNTTEVLL